MTGITSSEEHEIYTILGYEIPEVYLILSPSLLLALLFGGLFVRYEVKGEKGKDASEKKTPS